MTNPTNTRISVLNHVQAPLPIQKSRNPLDAIALVPSSHVSSHNTFFKRTVTSTQSPASIRWPTPSAPSSFGEASVGSGPSGMSAASSPVGACVPSEAVWPYDSVTGYELATQDRGACYSASLVCAVGLYWPTCKRSNVEASLQPNHIDPAFSLLVSPRITRDEREPKSFLQVDDAKGQ